MWRQEGSSGTFLCLSKANVLCSELLISQLMKNSVLCVYVPLCMCVCVCVSRGGCGSPLHDHIHWIPQECWASAVLGQENTQVLLSYHPFFSCLGTSSSGFQFCSSRRAQAAPTAPLKAEQDPRCPCCWPWSPTCAAPNPS